MRPLQLEDTVPAVEIRHRLLLGIELADGLSGRPALGPLRVTLESLGKYRVDTLLEERNAHRHCIVHSGDARKRLERAVAAGLDTTIVVRVESLSRRYVQRRLRLSLSLTGSDPVLIPATSNIRAVTMLPGATYMFSPTATMLRGRVLRGATLTNAVPHPWTKVFATFPHTALAFDSAKVVGMAHGDDRGEFVLAIRREAFPAAALPPEAEVRLWVFRQTPFAALSGDPADGLRAQDSGLGASAAERDVLGGTSTAGFVSVLDVQQKVRLARIESLSDSQLLIP